jgi:propionyl-CoA carboxylase alpha chain
VTLRIAGVRRRYAVVVDGAAVHVDGPEGSWSFAPAPRFPEPDRAGQAGSLVAPMPGAVIRVAVEPGAEVHVGQVVVVLEAMKMEHDIVAPASGTVTEVLVERGEQVDAGRPLLVVSSDPA